MWNNIKYKLENSSDTLGFIFTAEIYLINI